MSHFISSISHKKFPVSEKIPAKIIRTSILDIIRKEHPNFGGNDAISIEELNIFREKYVTEFLQKQIGDLSQLEKNVIESLANHSMITEKDDDDDTQTKTTFGQKVADKVARFGGSWTFILSFGFFLAVWILINLFWLSNQGFDPYPFILLNLILSTLAALQAPVIMMSQNRQEEKDRERAKKDYMVNLKAEMEIRMLHEKIDHLLIHQQQELLEIQKVQIEMMNDIILRVDALSGKKQ